MHGVKRGGEAIDQIFYKDVNDAISDEIEIFETLDMANMTFDH